MAIPKWTYKDIPDQAGRTVIVTGANSGIGYDTARGLAAQGAQTIMACRSPERGRAAMQKIRQQHPDAQLEVMHLDLSDLGSVRTFADTFKARFERLDLLINNAGIMMTPQGQTSQGFELQMGTNHLGHFALTGLLLDRLRATPGSRVVNVSSTMQRFAGPLDLENMNAEKRYDKTAAYSQSKLANLLFTYELQRRIEQSEVDISVTAAHPGYTGTNLQRHTLLFRMLNPIFSQSQAMGALPTLYAAVGPESSGGHYYGPRSFAESRGYPTRVQSNEASHDIQAAAELWSRSEAMTGVVFAEL